MLYCSLDCAKECAEGNQMNEIKFADLGLDKEILRAIQKKGYESPTPVQAQAIPPILKRLDVMAAAQTGTGKTAGFTLPILHRLLNGPRPKANEARVLILTPTRELAAQVVDNVRDYGRYLNLSYAVAFGGVSINPQKMKLRRGVDILVATPGRLLDLYNQRAVKFPNLEIFVLDEADRMLDMGFIHDIKKKTIALLPKKRQNLMFSATFSLEIRKLAKGLIHNPVEISIGVANSAIEVIKQWHVNVEQKQKANLLIHLIKENNWQQVLVFMRTKHGANRLVKKLDSVGINALAIHGNKSQGARTKALADFKSGDVKILVATDIAARGIDINQLPLVINFRSAKCCRRLCS
jgi:ATP-dependent RNA helicase RhlE